MRLFSRLRPGPVAVRSIGLDALPEAIQGDILEQVFPHLIAESLIPDGRRRDLGYALRWGDEVLEILVCSTPQGDVALTAADLARLGGTRVREAAIANLRLDPVEERIATEPGHGAIIHTVYGTTSHTASRAVILEDELDLVGKHPDGALFAIPNPGNLLFQPLVDRSAATAFLMFSLTARAAYKNGSPPISPHLYWWKRGKVRQVTRNNGRRFHTDIPSDLMAVFERLVRDP